MEKEFFNEKQIVNVFNAVNLAEELVSNDYKMSNSQWLKNRYDIKTLSDLSPNEIVDIPFAHIIRYRGQKKETSLGSNAYDFYKICIQDHNVLSAIKNISYIKFFPFILYIVTHELIHIVRFSKFLQSFDASIKEKLEEEKRVHNKTRQILAKTNIQGLDSVVNFKGFEICSSNSLY